VAELLSAQGGTIANRPTNYFQMERETLKIRENVAKVFMGMRIQCSSATTIFRPVDAHDYYGFEAFFTQIGRRQDGRSARNGDLQQQGR